MLQAKDLIVGDWVLLFDNTPVKVDCIGNIEVYLSEPKGQHELNWRVTYEHIKPISLTPEILEKNGFVYNDMPFAQSWEQFGLALYLGGDGYRINCGQNVTMIIDSVHELQHALRLCGIDKTIEL